MRGARAARSRGVILVSRGEGTHTHTQTAIKEQLSSESGTSEAETRDERGIWQPRERARALLVSSEIYNGAEEQNEKRVSLSLSLSVRE